MITKNKELIKNIFNKVSYKYDFFNNLFSFGLHNLWKKKLINFLQPVDGEEWGDLCCGTGDLTFLLSKLVSPNGNVVGIDISTELLNIARNKSNYATKKCISWKEKDIFDLDSETNKFDGICMSYGLRNLRNAEDGINKIFFLLKENGRAGFLDFNHCKDKSFSSSFQKLYLRFIVVPISALFNLRDEYDYIEKSIKEFPTGEQLIQISRNNGFKKAKYITLLGKQMGILLLEK